MVVGVFVPGNTAERCGHLNEAIRAVVDLPAFQAFHGSAGDADGICN
jgi:hypothetical protein